MSLEKNLRVLPVCDAEHRVVGVFDESSLLRGLGHFLGIGPRESDQQKPE